MTRLILVLGDQLTPTLSALEQAAQGDIIVMAEVADETTYVPHHPKKIAFVLTAMRKFAAQLRDDGLTVVYTKLDDPENTGSITGELLRRAAEYGTSTVICRWTQRSCPIRGSSPHMPSSRHGRRTARNCGWSGFTATCAARPGC